MSSDDLKETPEDELEDDELTEDEDHDVDPLRSGVKGDNDDKLSDLLDDDDDDLDIPYSDEE